MFILDIVTVSSRGKYGRHLFIPATTIRKKISFNDAKVFDETYEPKHTQDDSKRKPMMDNRDIIQLLQIFKLKHLLCQIKIYFLRPMQLKCNLPLHYMDSQSQNTWSPILADS